MTDGEHCAYCGGYVDAMNDDAIGMFRKDGSEMVWCSIAHLEQYAAAQREHDDHPPTDTSPQPTME